MLEAKRAALAVAAVTAATWVLCSAYVAVAPHQAMRATGHLVHADLSGISWTIDLPSVAIGLVVWTLTSAGFTWCAVTTYNLLARRKESGART